MRSFSPRRLAPILCLFCLPALSQEPTVAHICVAVLRSGTDTVPAPEVRDRLVKDLNQQKPDKKLHLSATAVPLEDTWGTKAREEAQGKSCEFVLSTRLTDLQTSSVPSATSTGVDYVPIFRATVEYQLIRTLDGTIFATELEKGEDSSSLREAVWEAIAHVASITLPEIAKNGNPAPAISPAPANQSAGAASNRIEVAAYSPNACVWLPTDIPHAEAVAGVCRYAMSLPETMPNFICDQIASRFWGKNKVPFDLVTASVRYEDGSESYNDIKVNGRPAPEAITKTPGLWSTGEFGSNLRSIFDTRNQALFEFTRESQWKEHSAWVFTYTIAKQNDPLWRLSTGQETLAPPYKGELWVDQQTGELLRFGSVATDIPKTFAVADAEAQVDYADVVFADGTSFVLPADFTVTSALRGQQTTRNLVQFRNCHKFRAKSRMVLDVPAASQPAEDAGTSSVARTDMELENNNKIYAILREQAVREDAVRLELESRADQQAATAAAVKSWKTLQEKRQKNPPEAAATASSVPPPSTSEGLTTLKVSVKLVPVSVVLRDTKGNAVGNLRKEDFQLFDNGKPQAITSFSVEKSGAAAVAADQESEKSSVQPRAALVSHAPSSATARDVAYVFDDLHAAFGDLVQARAAALQHLGALPPQDRAAFFTTSGDIGIDFTADREKLKQALNAMRQHPAIHGSTCPPVSEYMADLIVNHDDLEALDAATKDAASCAFGGMGGGARAEQVARSAAREMLSATSAASQNTLGVLQQVISRTAAMPASRSIVLVSPGFLTLTPETRQSVMELVDRAVRANIIVHTLDVRGLYTPGLPPNMSHPADPVLRAGLDRDEAMAQTDIMADLAYGTGGTFFHNSNDVSESFRRTADPPEYIYVLGFSPQKLDGKFHKLSVKLAVPEKLTVQSRQGYYALTPASAQ